MPDMITHMAIAHLIIRPLVLTKTNRSPGAMRWLFYLGTSLPDILTRPWYILIPATHDWMFPFHTPIGAFLACGIFALLFKPALQKKAFMFLGLGSVLHFLLDGFQKQIVGNNYWLYPFTWKDFGYGILWAGDIMTFIPVWLVLIALLEIGIAIRKKRTGK
jgi:hypothetical protein